MGRKKNSVQNKTKKKAPVERIRVQKEKVPHENEPRTGKMDFLRPYKNMLAGSVGAAWVLFIAIRNLYPFPDFISDSRAYLLASITHEKVGVRPLGYSRFLEVVQHFAVSLPSIVWAQFLLHLIACLLLNVLVIYIFKPRRGFWPGLIMAASGMCNLTLLYLANCLTSDSLFISLTILWLVTLMAFIHSRNGLLLAGNIAIMYACLEVRYVALFYPVVTIGSVIFLLNKKYLLLKSLACMLVIGVSGIFYLHKLDENEEVIGLRIFSAFTGHQYANNAFEVYKHQPSALVGGDSEMMMIERWHKIYLDSLQQLPEEERKKYMDVLSVQELWLSNSADHKMEVYEQNKLNVSSFIAWNYAAEPLGRYGKAYIKKYPVSFLRYYLLPNTALWFFPQYENLKDYAANKEYLFDNISAYFSAPPKTHNSYAGWVKPLNTPNYILNAVGAVIFLPLTLLLLVTKKYRLFSGAENRVLFIGALFTGLGSAFLIYAAPVMYRYTAVNAVILIPLEVLILARIFGRKKDHSLIDDTTTA